MSRKINTPGNTMSTIENRMIDIEKIAKQTESILLDEIARKSATLEFISNHGLYEKHNSFLTEKGL